MRWVLLAYRLPREPSTPRIAAWRKLRGLGVVQLLDGLVGLPLDARNRERLEWIAQDVEEAGGEASVWIAEPESSGRGTRLAERMRDAVAAEYRAIRDEAMEAARTGSVDGRTLARLRRELRKVRARDYFPPPEADEVRVAVESLAARTEAAR